LPAEAGFVAALTDLLSTHFVRAPALAVIVGWAAALPATQSESRCQRCPFDGLLGLMPTDPRLDFYK